MGNKKDQHKVGAPQKPRGQQTGFAGNPDQNREAMKETPALRGRRKNASKMFADDSAQHVGGDAATPRSNTPSVAAAAPTGTKLGETGGEKVFKQRQRKNAK
ncbi:MAG: hypothetical protein QOH63_1042 [Acidobacteriota bacterium]|jgi:hypothetical protein|nr:hypothetical protein [Acidobacteriota bacterium]